MEDCIYMQNAKIWTIATLALKGMMAEGLPDVGEKMDFLYPVPAPVQLEQVDNLSLFLLSLFSK